MCVCVCVVREDHLVLDIKLIYVLFSETNIYSIEILRVL